MAASFLYRIASIRSKEWGSELGRYTFRRPKNNRILVLVTLLCVGLILLILYVQGRIVGLRQLLSQMNLPETPAAEEEVVEPVTLPYSQDIRVVLMDSDQNIYRGAVCVYGDGGMSVTTGNLTSAFGANEVYQIADAQCRESGNVRIVAAQGGELYLQNENGQISNGYEGTLELCATQEGIVVVNEIPIEYYLKRVVPSEMPRTYGAEALKAQAVCARTYAYGHSNTYAYPEVNAQMDDTVSFQVYNQTGESQETNQAVADTAGQILTGSDGVIDALYYSTSCGYAQDGTIFGEHMDTDIFTSFYIGMEHSPCDFDTYLRSPDESAYESSERYFRWTVQLSDDNGNMEVLRTRLQALLASGEDIECSKKMKKKITDTSLNAEEAFGGICDLVVRQRNAGGAVMTMDLVCETGTVTICDQLHIREVLGSLAGSLQLQNNEVVAQVNSLPSAAISVQKQTDGTFVVYGGGYGHGVGMSQNGAKALAALGYNYQDILSYFYKNTTLASWEE